MVSEKLDNATPSLFLDGPGEFLAMQLAAQINLEPHFNEIFQGSVFDYQREDISYRELPALRIYTLDYTKEQESHYINGDVHADVIFPPNIRRENIETLSSRIASALLQQFRRPPFFATMCDLVPGLNELGKVFNINKSMVFQNTEQTDECPVVKITLNFRLDLKVWDQYLIDNGRTKDDPFDVTLKNLKIIAGIIQAIREEVGEVPQDIQLGILDKV